MSKPEEGKHARAKERVKAAVLVAPAVLTSAAVAFTVAAYQPLVYDPDSIAHGSAGPGQRAADCRSHVGKANGQQSRYRI